MTAKIHRPEPKEPRPQPPGDNPPLPPVRSDGLHSMCVGKKRYSTLKISKRVIAKVRAERGVELRTYPCPICSGWHLTSQKKRER